MLTLSVSLLNTAFFSLPMDLASWPPSSPFFLSLSTFNASGPSFLFFFSSFSLLFLFFFFFRVPQHRTQNTEHSTGALFSLFSAKNLDIIYIHKIPPL